MPRHFQIHTDFSRKFFSPISDLYLQSARQYDCTGISDLHFCQLGVLRCLTSATTGHEFLQHHADQNVADIDPGHFFKALKSPRRLTNISSLNVLLALPMKQRVPDPYLQCPELASWDIYGMDGHYHKAACFDPKTISSKGTLRALATGHFFRVNLRTHHLSFLDIATFEDGKKKAHDLTVIKRAPPDALRNGAAKGRKVMLVWDKACIDYRLWRHLKHTHGIYFLTMEKSNSTTEITPPNLLDRDEPRNQGVVSDHHVSTASGVKLRRIVYTNPEDGVTYTYLNNDFTLPAYQLVILYKHRWDIEKIFHQLKGKMDERKSWASATEAKQSHSIFECLAHNLLLLWEQYLVQEEGLRDEVEVKRQLGRMPPASDLINPVTVVGNFINSAITRATQRTERFIRWVRGRIYQQVPWVQSLARLRELWGDFVMKVFHTDRILLKFHEKEDSSLDRYDHFSARLGIGLAIREEPDMTVIAEATNGTQAVNQYAKHLPDVVIMDYNLPDFNSVEATKKIHVGHPEARILMFTIHEGEDDIHRATCAEVYGYIAKSAELDEVLCAIRTMGSGGRWFPRSISAKLESHGSHDHLSDREIDILRHIVRGSANKEIADSLHLSGGTVKRHVSLILEKLGGLDRTRAAILAIERGLIRLGG